MKILVYSISSPHEITGIGKYNGELLDWLWDKNHHTDVMTALPYYPYWEIYEGFRGDKFKVETFENGNIYSVRLPVSKNVSSIQRVWMELVLMLKTCLKVPYLSFKNRYDVILLVLPPLSIFPVAILSKYFGSSKLHVHIQDLQIEAARELNLFPDLLLNVLERIEKMCLYFADFVTSISDNMVDQLKMKNNGPSNKTEVIENWADTEFIQPIEEKNWLKKEYGISVDTFLIVYSGNIGEKQGLGQILSVAKALEEYEDIKLLILGDGAYKEELLNMSKSVDLSNLSFGKLVPKKYLNLMLNGSDIQLVLQSKLATDSFLPSKYINILSAGVPSIVTAKEETELNRIVRENNTSILVEPEDVAQLTDAILKLYRNKDLRETLSQNSRKFAVEKFGRDFILNRLMSYYHEIV